MPATATISLSSFGMPLIFAENSRSAEKSQIFHFWHDFGSLASSNFLRPPHLSGFPKGNIE